MQHFNSIEITSITALCRTFFIDLLRLASSRCSLATDGQRTWYFQPGRNPLVVTFTQKRRKTYQNAPLLLSHAIMCRRRKDNTYPWKVDYPENCCLFFVESNKIYLRHIFTVQIAGDFFMALSGKIEETVFVCKIILFFYTK